MHRRPTTRSLPSTLALAALLGACGGPLDGTTGDDGSEASNALLATKDGCWSGDTGTALRMKDDDTRKVDLPFEFPFFDRKFSTLYANSNGNVTLGTGSTAATGRLPDGTRPVVAVLFGDLNPEAGDGVGGANDVSVAFSGLPPERAVIVTWNLVPEFRSTLPNTFQLRLEESGRITVSYLALNSDGVAFSGAPMVAGLSSGTGTVVELARGTAIAALSGTSRTYEPDGAGSYFVRSGCFAPPAAQRRNQPPVSDAGADLVVECAGPAGTTVTLDGTASSDPDGDALQATWSEGADVLASELVANVTLPVGTHEVALEVTDAEGERATDTVQVTVTDSGAPELAFETLETVLWPPNGTFRKVLRGVVANDACCDATLSVQVSGPPEDSRVVTGTDGAVDVYVRARRDGQELDGRTYVVTVTATDCGGRVTTRTVKALVPHDQR